MATQVTIGNVRKRWSEQVYNTNRPALDYIVELAARARADIRRWNLERVFGDGVTEGIVNDRRELNRRFFERLGSSGAADDVPENAELPALPAGVLEGIKRNLAASGDARLEQARAALIYAEREVERVEHTLRVVMTRFIDAQRTLDTMVIGVGADGTRVDMLARQVQELIAEGTFEDPMVDDHGVLYLVMTAPCILTHRNRSANLDISVDMGRFCISLDFHNAGCRVLPFKHNRNVDRYFHPHVNAAGTPCWGDALRAATEHVRTGNVKGVCNLAMALLNTYTPDQPYRPLAAFVDAGRYTTRAESLICPQRRRQPVDEELAPSVVVSRTATDSLF